MRRRLLGAAVAAALFAGCPWTAPAVDQTGKHCSSGDLCPSGLVCAAGVCAAACQGGAVEIGGLCQGQGLQDGGVDAGLDGGADAGRDGGGDGGGDAGLTGCTTGSDCHDGGPRCDLDSGACVGCLVDSDCALGSYCVETHCIQGCDRPNDCPPVTNGLSGCVDGGCAIVSCDAPFATCGGAGCGVDLAVDPANCGGCGMACRFANADAGCADSGCQLLGCDPGFGNCDGDAGNGCEAALLMDVANCGTCGSVCSTVNGQPACVDGGCEWSCDAGYGHCATGNTGCETDLGTTVADCGACARGCASTEVAVAACAGGLCTSSCLPGFGNCSEPAAPLADDGCETNLRESDPHCGSCLTACSTAESCVDGGCAACPAGHSDCDGIAANGCECATPGCCSGGSGGSCETIHSNGLGQSFYDCNPLGTYTAQAAAEAAAAWAPDGGAESSIHCGTGNPTNLDTLCSQFVGSCACWGYANKVAGEVSGPGLGCSCPTGGSWN
ncbi:MAG: hypothetical protein ACYCWW_05255 [Deltaproteobacteria bacterium]